MRTESEVTEYAQRAEVSMVYSCPKCAGKDPVCECRRRYMSSVAAYEACVPRDFWDIKVKDVTHNVEVFKGVVLKYVKRLDRALSKGYGLAFLGDNGVGKTYFMSYVLMAAIRAGRTAYYTTMPQLDHDMKRGFNDPAIEKRLNWLLTSDFLALDEMGKEHRRSRSEATYTDTQVERILKQRCDDSQPAMLATNMDHESLVTSYGPTVGSIIGGKYQAVVMEPGDYRNKMAKRMTKDMGY